MSHLFLNIFITAQSLCSLLILSQSILNILSVDTVAKHAFVIIY